MRELIAEFFAVLNSDKFTAYADGVSVDLPTGETVLVKTLQTTRSIRPVGFRFSEFAFITEISAGSHIGVGFGEAPTRLIALQKSIAEGVERVLYKTLKNTPFGSPNSNGWAAHLNPEKALESGLEEILERDAVLVHWFCKKGMSEINPSSWPTWLKNWARAELKLSPRFNTLRILVSDLGHLPTVTTVFLSKDHHAVLSHATASTLESAIRKALMETCRIGQIAMEHDQKNEKPELKHPTDHAMYYAFYEKIPSWIFGPPSNWKQESRNWAVAYKNFNAPNVNPTFHQITESPLSVGYCTSDLIQNLFFGWTEEAQRQGLLNTKRLKAVNESEFNLMPHWVP